MTFTLLNGVLLTGLAAVAIPPIIHLLNRKRFDQVDWAAMQFLQITEQTRRKIFLEEVLLMLLRMGLLALLVLALTAPIVTSEMFMQFGTRSNRDIVLIIDGSMSMGTKVGDATPDDAARTWVKQFVDTIVPGDGIAILQAKQVPITVLGTFSTDPDKVRAELNRMAPPRGGSDLPAAVQVAEELLQQSRRPEREIIVITDGQRNGLADDATLARWSDVQRTTTATEDRFRPRLWFVNVAGGRPADLLNWSLLPLRTNRSIPTIGLVDRTNGTNEPPPGSEVRFETSLRVTGRGDGKPPAKLRVEVDGRLAGYVPVPPVSRSMEQKENLVPIAFTQRFSTPGTHVLSVSMDDDNMPGDNRRDFALRALPAIPVLIIEGEAPFVGPADSSPRRTSDYLSAALAPKRDDAPAFQVFPTPNIDFVPEMLRSQRIAGKVRPAPRVVILQNVPKLTPTQEKALDEYIKGGGAVLVTLGDRVNADDWNRLIYRGGRGWLPGRLVQPVGEIGDAVDLANAPRPLASSLVHPAFVLFQEGGPTARAIDLLRSYFPRYWMIELKERGPARVVASLTSQAPWFTEREYGQGKVMMCCVPLDNTWRTNLVTGIFDFPRLAHELMYYLAGTRGTSLNLQPGQPISFTPDDEAEPTTPTDAPKTLGSVKVKPPLGEEQTYRPTAWPLEITDTRETGIYTITYNDKTYHFVVQANTDESDLAPWTQEDRDSLAEKLPNAKFLDEVTAVNTELNRSLERQEVWWWFLLGVVLLLGVEVYYTRKIALRANS